MMETGNSVNTFTMSKPCQVSVNLTVFLENKIDNLYNFPVLKYAAGFLKIM